MKCQYERRFVKAIERCPAVRILLTRISKEGGLPVGLTSDPEAHDAWFRAQVLQALADDRPSVSHQQVMDQAQALIDKKRRNRP